MLFQKGKKKTSCLAITFLAQTKKIDRKEEKKGMKIQWPLRAQVFQKRPAD